MFDVDGRQLDFADGSYWEGVTRSLIPVRLRFETLVGPGYARNWGTLLQAVALPRGVVFDQATCAFVFSNGRTFATCAHVVLGRMCKQFQADLWHLHFHVARLQKLTHLVADSIALDFGSMSIV